MREENCLPDDPQVKLHVRAGGKRGQGGQPPPPLCAERGGRGGGGGQFEVRCIPYDSTAILLLMLLFVSLEMSALNPIQHTVPSFPRFWWNQKQNMFHQNTFLLLIALQNLKPSTVSACGLVNDTFIVLFVRSSVQLNEQ